MGRTVNMRERIGIDVGDQLSVLDAIKWASSNNVQHIDVKLGHQLEDGIPDDVANQVRELCTEHGIRIGLHTSSSVNMAENQPFIGNAVDDYLFAFVDAASQLNADYIIVHGGYHFTSDIEGRLEASLDRITRTVEYAEENNVGLLLENHNPEPDAAEVHYIPTSPEECTRYFSKFSSEELGWAFNPAHANLDQAGIAGFVSALNLRRCGEVRLDDNHGEKEEHLPPGEGSIDFERLFELVEAEYDGHYVISFGTPDEMLEAREYLLKKAS